MSVSGGSEDEHGELQNHPAWKSGDLGGSFSLPLLCAVILGAFGTQWPDWEDFPENLWVFHNLLG